LVMANAPEGLRKLYPSLSKGVEECGVVAALEQAAAARRA
jgi:hypothetical protein